MNNHNDKPENEKDLPANNPSGQDVWPEDDVAEKYIKSGGKVETPSTEEEEEAEQLLKESKQPKK